jgi:hypothetical protein
MITNIMRDWGVGPCIVRVTTTDDLAAITTAGYLTDEEANIEALQNGEFEWVDGDMVAIFYSDGEGFFTRDSTDNTFVALATVPGTLSNTLQDGRIFVGSAGNVATGVPMSGDATIINTGAVTLANNAVTTAKLALNTIQYAQVSMSAADWNGMYGAPKLLIAAPGAGKLIIVDSCVLTMTFVSAQYAAGGAIALQYDSTVHGAGTLASATLAAATVNAYAASSNVSLAPLVTSSAITTTQNKGLYLSNQTAAFTTGDSTWTVSLAYRIITA